MAQGSLRKGAALALLALAGCAAPASPPPATPPPRVAPPSPAPAPAPHIAVAPAPPVPRADACGALPLQYLVGRPRTEIPVPVYPDRRRVVCATCFVTQDYVEGRQTIVYDSETGLVKSIRCG
jgi:hypothetical protein